MKAKKRLGNDFFLRQLVDRVKELLTILPGEKILCSMSETE